jgi:hypothetical protein
MKITFRLALASTLLLMLSAPLNAGTVRLDIFTGNFEGPGFRKWYCDQSLPPRRLPAVFRCESVRFQQCGSCNTVVVQNNSSMSATVEFEFDDAGFSEDHFPGRGTAAGTPCESSNDVAGRPFSYTFDCDSLGPGETCKQDIQFCPDRAGTSRGRVTVIATANGKSLTIAADLIGDALYSPELQAADEARRRHLDELMKIPHVAKVDLDPKGHDIFINLEVEQDASLDKVRRAAPPKIEGYDVEVTTYIPVGWAL